MRKHVKCAVKLSVPIIYMLLSWSEYNYRHALKLSKVSR